MNKEKITTELIQHSNGITIVKSDLTTGKVIINNIEITSIEDWNKVTHSIVELQKENEKLNHYKLLYQKVKERNTKVIDYIEKNCWLSAMKEFNCLESGEVKYLVEILKGDNEVSNEDNR